MTLTGLKQIVTDIKFVDSISSGDIKPFRAFGYRNNTGIDATGNDIWPGTAILVPIPPDAGEQMQVVSSSVNDTAAGTGARQVEIHYIDASGAEQAETVTLNGTTPVLTAATNIRFVQEMHVISAGTNLLAVGTITISKAGVPATVYTQVQPQTNQSLNTARMVPAGKVLLIEQWNASAGNATKVEAVDIRIRATSHHGILQPRLFQFIDNFQSFNSATERPYIHPVVIPAFAIVKCTAYAAVAGSNVQASFEGILINTPV